MVQRADLPWWGEVGCGREFGLREIALPTGQAGSQRPGQGWGSWWKEWVLPNLRKRGSDLHQLPKLADRRIRPGEGLGREQA